MYESRPASQVPPFSLLMPGRKANKPAALFVAPSRAGGTESGRKGCFCGKQDLQARFKTALPDKMANLEPKEFVGVLLQATDCEKGDYQMGQDMVFFKGSKGAVLQELMLTPKEEVAQKIVEKLKKNNPSDPNIKVFEEFIKARQEARKQMCRSRSTWHRAWPTPRWLSCGCSTAALALARGFRVWCHHSFCHTGRP